MAWRLLSDTKVLLHRDMLIPFLGILWPFFVVWSAIDFVDGILDERRPDQREQK